MNTYKVELTKEGLCKEKCPHGLKATRGKVIMLGSLECSMCHYYVDIYPELKGGDIDNWFFQKIEISKTVHCTYDERIEIDIKDTYK